MTAQRFDHLSDDELEALTNDELLSKLDPLIAGELRDIWSRIGSLPGDWADELISDRREQVLDRPHAK